MGRNGYIQNNLNQTRELGVKAARCKKSRVMSWEWQRKVVYKMAGWHTEIPGGHIVKVIDAAEATGASADFFDDDARILLTAEKCFDRAFFPSNGKREYFNFRPNDAGQYICFVKKGLLLEL